MLAKLELRLPELIHLYNLLVPEVQKFVDAGQLQPELVTLLDQTNAALDQLTGEVSWFVCVKEGCDHRPFYLKASELSDAEGVISCEVCDRLCHRVQAEALQQPLFS
jgi:hypothetical protein